VFVVIDILPIVYGLHTPVLMCLTEKRVVVEEAARLSEKADKSRGSATSGGSNGSSSSGLLGGRRHVTSSPMDMDPTTAPLLTPQAAVNPEAGRYLASSFGPEEEDIPIPGYKGNDAINNSNPNANSGWGGYVSYWTGGGAAGADTAGSL